MEEAVRDRLITRRNPIAIGYRDYINRTERTLEISRRTSYTLIKSSSLRVSSYFVIFLFDVTLEFVIFRV